MSLDVAEASAPAKQALTTAQRRDLFNYLHRSAVRRDFSDAWSHAKNGRFTLVVTPEHPAIRLTNSSAVRVDMTGAGCESYNWLRDLYRATCPKGMKVEFGYHKLEGIFMLDVRIFIIGQPKKEKGGTPLQR